MKTAWWVLAAISLLCGMLCAWLLFTSAAGARMLAAAQLFVLGAISSVACAGISASLGDRRQRLFGAGMVAAYGVALLAFMTAMGSVR